jgi:type 1 glutamine amidotransferase
MSSRTLLGRTTPLLLLAALAATPAAAQERLRTLVLTGEDEVHDWRFTSTYLRQLLEESGKFRVEIETLPATTLEDEARLARYGLVVVDYDGARWGERAEAGFLSAVEGGTGVVLLHAANSAFREWKEYGELVGATRAADAPEAPFATVTVEVLDAKHPVTAGLDVAGERPDGLLAGWRLRGEGHRVLARATSQGWGAGGIGAQPVAIASERGEGRVFQLLLGHVGYGEEDSWSSWRDARFQNLLLRGAEWAATGKVTPMSKVAPNTLTAADRAAGWRLLVEGEDARGWKRFERLFEDRWEVEDGRIQLLSETGQPLHEEPFVDFEFEAEWRVPEGALAAYAAREEREGRTPPAVSADDPDSLVDARLREGVLPEAAYVLRPPGEWNHVRVVARDYTVEHWLNGIRVLTIPMDTTEWAELVAGTGWLSDPDLGRMPLGRLAKIDAGIDVWFRNVKIRPLLPPEEPLLAQPEPIELFDGRTLDGWTLRWWGQTVREGLWSYRGGALVCRGSHFSYLVSAETYEDFVLELEQRWSPVSRQAGKASVLVFMQGDDGFYPQNLEVRLAHRELGSIWAHEEFPYEPHPTRTLAPITREIEDADAPVGEWNLIVVRAQDGRLTVHANGVLVNELDGVGGLPGHVALVSDGPEVWFRNVVLTPLPGD